MKKPSQLALAFAFATATAAGAASAQTIDNWRNSFGQVWKNGTQEHCWRDAFWTPATAAVGCDGGRKGGGMAPKVAFNADAFFDFDEATLNPDGRRLLDQVAAHLLSLSLETIITTGHADSTGPDEYNQELSERRSQAVKRYLMNKGIDANRIYTDGKGETQPIATNKTVEGRKENRRVELHITGSRKTP
jgi:OOP family OmpA-OmpF porin